MSPAASSPAGYSGRPLTQKLGLKAGRRLLLLAAPGDVVDSLQPWPEGLRLSAVGEGEALPPAQLTEAGPATEAVPAFDHILAFFQEHARLVDLLPQLKQRLAYDGGLWIAWPKRASGRPTDLTEDAIRNLALAGGLVDNKVCAIDAVWSGLRLVYRLTDRPKRG